MNDSLRRDLDSTLEDSDIVEYGTLEIKKAADEYEESNKPDPNQLQLSREGISPERQSKKCFVTVGSAANILMSAGKVPLQAMHQRMT